MNRGRRLLSCCAGQRRWRRRGGAARSASLLTAAARECNWRWVRGADSARVHDVDPVRIIGRDILLRGWEVAENWALAQTFVAGRRWWSGPISLPTPPHILCCGATWQSTTCISLLPSTFTNPNRSLRNLLPLGPSTRSELFCYLLL